MVFNVKTLIRAELELDEAVFYYENIQKGLGERFLLDYENQLDTLYNFPFFENKYSSVRVLPLKKFPYTIHFTINETEKLVSIQAITCDYQNPENTKLKI
ncbi:MAG: hypothetical protein RL494_1699 [Bacteroidota bacterium]|jgi:hypothetical protein